MIVEGDRTLRELLHYVLEEEGYALAFASSLEEAAAQCAPTYHLILIDLFRPSLHDLFSAALHLHQWCQPTPVGLLSSWEIPPEITQRMQLAFVLPKPFDLEQLLSAVASAVYAPGGQNPSAGRSTQPAILLAPLR